MADPMRPEDVPDELARAAADMLEQNGLWGGWERNQSEDEVRGILASVLPLHEQQLRAQLRVEWRVEWSIPGTSSYETEEATSEGNARYLAGGSTAARIQTRQATAWRDVEEDDHG